MILTINSLALKASSHISLLELVGAILNVLMEKSTIDCVNMEGNCDCTFAVLLGTVGLREGLCQIGVTCDIVT